MPNGKPDLVGVVKYPTISKLIQENGRQGVRATIFLLVKNFCESINVIRGMNEDQMIEAASFLLDECGNYRMEDYVMMFTMAKRGQLVKILDRVDIQIIGQIFSEYDRIRYSAGEQAYIAQIKALDTVTDDIQELLPPEEIEKEKNNFKKAVEAFTKKMDEKAQKREEAYLRQKEEFEQKRSDELARYEQYKKEAGIPDDKPLINTNEFKKK